MLRYQATRRVASPPVSLTELWGNRRHELLTYPAELFFLSFLHALSLMVSQRLNRHSKSSWSSVEIRAGQSIQSRFPLQSWRVLAARVRMSWTAR